VRDQGPPSPPAVTRDALFHGRLTCRQHRRGYRFSVDSLLAARFCRPADNDHVLDLGAGCGVIGLILAHLWPNIRVTSMELQDSLARLVRDNIRDNGFDERMQLIKADLKEIGQTLPHASCDLVVSNPPYRPLGSARLDNGNPERARARHELDAALNEVIAAAAYAVRERGMVVLVLPAGRTAEACTLLRQFRLEPKRLRPVYSYPADSRARLILIEAVKGGGAGLDLLPPLCIFTEAGGDYSPEMERWYRDETAGGEDADLRTDVTAGDLHAGPRP